MRRVLVVGSAACLCAGAVLTVANANAGKPSAPPPRHRVVQAPPAAVERTCRLPSGYRREFAAASRATGLPVAMLVAVGEVESHLTQSAVSNAGAEGVLQLLPSTASALGLDASRPRSNVLAGATYLRQLLERFDSVDVALAAYNAGPSAVERAGGAPTIETLRYVANVNARWRDLRRCV
ncbi:MAG TPA: lytic transglycosylase domain-containing protein [Gaiellaceae bacterium]